VTIDFSQEGDQQSREVIPDGSIVALNMQVTHGGGGADGWLRKSKTGDSLGLNCKFVVLDGPHKGVSFFTLFTLSGTTDGHRDAARISGAYLRAILESAKGVAPDPTKTNPTWLQAVRINSYGDFHGLCFLAKVKVLPAQNGYAAKNVIQTVITPNMKEYFKVEPPPDAASASAPASASSSQTVIPLPAPSPPVSTARPAWAK
jgi:hypothetical protein